MLLSIDVGIKNLAICIIEPLWSEIIIDPNAVRIIKWDIVDISTDEPTRCCEPGCMAQSVFIYNESYLCKAHAKIIFPHVHIPTKYTNISIINKMSLLKLNEIIEKYNIPIDNTLKLKKEDKKARVIEFVTQRFFKSVIQTNASKVHLQKVATHIKSQFTKLLTMYKITHVAIENQFGPLAVRMKAVQGMLTQFFVMFDETINIQFISSCNKLKLHTPVSEEKTTNDLKKSYDMRKQKGINNYRQFVQDNPSRISIEMQTHFNNHPKKDDLADSFLQGVWVIQNKFLF